MRIETIDDAMDLYGRMDRLQQAGVNIRIAALAEHYPARNSLVIKAVHDEAIGLPLPSFAPSEIDASALPR